MDDTTGKIKLESWPDNSFLCQEDPLALGVEDFDIKTETGCSLTTDNDDTGILKTEETVDPLAELPSEFDSESHCIKTEDPLAIPNQQQDDAEEDIPQLATRLHSTFCSVGFTDRMSFTMHLQSGCAKDLEAASNQSVDPLSTHDLQQASAEEEKPLLAKTFHCATCSVGLPDRKSLSKHLKMCCSTGIVEPCNADPQLDRVLRSAKKIVPASKKAVRLTKKVKQSVKKVTQKTKNVGKKVMQPSKKEGRVAKKPARSVRKVDPLFTKVTRSRVNNKIALETNKVGLLDLDTKDTEKVSRLPSEVAKPAITVISQEKEAGDPTRKVIETENDTNWSENNTNLPESESNWTEREEGASKSSTNVSENKKGQLGKEFGRPKRKISQPTVKPAIPKKRRNCNDCGKEFRSALNLRIHMTTHLEGTNFECSRCAMKFTSHRKLKKHVLLDHTKKTFGCDTCDKKFHSTNNLRAHLRTHLERKQFRCDECDKTFLTEQEKHTHTLTHSKEKGYMCEICGKRFAFKAFLQKHLPVHTGPKGHKCPLCHPFWNNLSYETKRKILSENKSGCPYVNNVDEKHKLAIAVDLKHKCETCGDAFRLVHELIRHKKAVHGLVEQRPFECALCGKTYSLHCQLRQHISLHVRGNNVKCDHCPLAFTSEQMLKRHLASHANAETPFECHLCPEKFAWAPGLEQHLSSHKEFASESDAKNHKFKCNRCEKSYKWLNSLERHYKVAHEEKKGNEPKVKNKCEVCGKCFCNAPYLRQHVATIHSTEPNAKESKYKCERCDKAYSYQSSLDRHIESAHVDQKKHKCEICGKFYCNAIAVQQHIATKHVNVPNAEGEKYECRICDVSFCNPGVVRHHIKREHGAPNDETLGEKNSLKCEYCSYRTIHLLNLKRHLRANHKSEIPKLKANQKTECEVCAKKFCSVYYLRAHLKRKHSEINDGPKQSKGIHKCDVCAKRFCTVNSLQRHVKSKHPIKGERNYKCDICGNRFVNRSSIRRHIKGEHLAEVHYLPEVKYLPELALFPDSDCQLEVNPEPEVKFEVSEIAGNSVS